VCKYFGETILKIITPVPDVSTAQPAQLKIVYLHAHVGRYTRFVDNSRVGTTIFFLQKQLELGLTDECKEGSGFINKLTPWHFHFNQIICLVALQSVVTKCFHVGSKNYQFLARVAKFYFFMPKLPISVYFGGYGNLKY
jgi:hypothetical protein